MKRAPIRLADLTEKEWQHDLVQLAQQIGWGKAYHVFDSRRSHSGFPDLVLVRDRIVFAELKREKTGPSDEQIEWLDKLAAAGGEVYLWRPSDLDEIARILGRRATFDAPTGALKQAGGWWQPRSRWIPGVGRADTHDNEQQTLLSKEAHA